MSFVWCLPMCNDAPNAPADVTRVPPTTIPTVKTDAQFTQMAEGLAAISPGARAIPSPKKLVASLPLPPRVEYDRTLYQKQASGFNNSTAWACCARPSDLTRR
jgi:hypothetical protein